MLQNTWFNAQQMTSTSNTRKYSTNYVFPLETS